MQNINWKTTAAGLLLIGEGVAHTFFGVNIPGFSMDLGAALTAGIGLILAKDG